MDLFNPGNMSDLGAATFIFFARIIDVSIGTMRIILISRGYRLIAPLLGFFEVIIWLLAVSQAIKHVGSVTSYIFYGAGFAAGNYLGMWIEGKIAIGYQAIRIITTEKILSLPLILRDEGYGGTTTKGMGAKGEVNIIFTITPRTEINHAMEIIHMFEPNAFVTIEDIRSTQRGFFSRRKNLLNLFGEFISKKK